ncbi:PREDICTED: probable plastid-lipid-associated protein 13, chloroplastic isoform X2 [Tarenaya hassleriana]|uniref:probable plastid-lipid-associated protein 13, chloroplastic isoform X2 n=1 Tax=Tarenaya hassleriana TaxID=28532 RepID=UPI00053C223B|nr:PREDICTED: probable plastid-lipid-associated protein 13, chloroplastic isoform X2 [Tarenaya hassleriana]
MSLSSSSMALLHGSVSATSAVRLGFSTTAPPSSPATVPAEKGRRRSCRRSIFRATVQPGAPSVNAKEMERLSAKESLLIAFNDSGGFEALVRGKTTDVQRIDVHERITCLERLNPTPRPAMSPYLQGRWDFRWLGSRIPGFFPSRVISERFPPKLANLSKMDVLIKDGNAKATASIRLLNSVESNIILTSRLSVEGPVRMKEEYAEGMVQPPKLIQEALPEQLRGLLGQATATPQQLPAHARDTLATGLRIPLGGSIQRFFMISYLDDEILVSLCLLNLKSRVNP